MFSGKRDKGNFWCEWAQRDDHHHSIIHFRPHHEEVGVCFLYSSVICDTHSWLFDCLLVCYLIVAVTQLNVVFFSIQMLVRCWLMLSEQSVTSTQLTVSWYQWIDLSNCGLNVSCWSCLPLDTVIHYDRTLPVHKVISFQCFDIVGWASGAAFGLSKMSDEVLA